MRMTRSKLAFFGAETYSRTFMYYISSPLVIVKSRGTAKEQFNICSPNGLKICVTYRKVGDSMTIQLSSTDQGICR